MAIVKGFDKGMTSSGRLPYILAALDCGHKASVEMKSLRGTCDTCGVERDLPLGVTQTCCGHSCFIVTFHANPHRDADRITQVGSVVECKACERETQQLAWLRGLDRGLVHHARFRNGSYHFYLRAPESPSGVLLIGSVACTPAVEALLTERSISPLSPTEGL